jgi:hypothetical protein
MAAEGVDTESTAESIAVEGVVESIRSTLDAVTLDVVALEGTEAVLTVEH